MQAVLLCALLLGQGEQRPLSPADALSQAHADLTNIQTNREHYRYLSMYQLPALERLAAIKVLNGHVNGLSREADLTPVKIVPNTQGALVRVNLLDYRWDAKVWEKLTDPYFTTTIEIEVTVPWEGGVWREDGKSYAAGSFTYTKKQKTLALAPWLGETEEQRRKLADVVKWTQSKIPIVRADWFFNQTAAAADRSPNYYDFLGIKDEKTYQDIIGFDAKKKRRKVEIREAVAKSGVTLKPRAIVRETSEDGGYWKSLDFKKATGKQNPLRILGGDIEDHYDASEQYGFLPNGLWATGLFDRKGAKQDLAPDFIASDGASRSNDRRVHVNVSCIRCHANGGLQSINGWVRNLAEPPLELRSPDYEKARELRQQYVRKIEPFIAKDRANYEEAIKEVTGLDSKQYAAAYGDFWERYEDADIGLNRAAADLGVMPARLRAAIGARVKSGQGDTVISALILDPPRINTIPVVTWEESFAEANLILRYYQQ